MSNIKNGRGPAWVLGLLATPLLWGMGLGVAVGAEATTLNGTHSGDRFGGALSGAGDVNGDGYQDFLVGAPGARGAAGITGTVSLFLGLADSITDVPDLVLEGETGGDEFGFAVARAGDVNGDGYDDFVVGAPSNDGSGLDAGRVYLFLGGGTVSPSPVRSWDGDLASSRFGAALAGGFDFNRDGFSDFAAGAPGSNLGANRAGQVKIYLGASSSAAIQQPPAFRFAGDQANWALGWSLHAAGDLNRDQYGDLVAGAPEPYDVNSGRAVIWFGQASTLATPSRLVLSGEVGSDRFGYSVASAGDRNQDGFDDVLIGAPGHDSQGFDKGAAYVFLGGLAMNAISDWKTVGAAGGDSLGYAVDGGEDRDGDQIPDILIGAPGADGAGAQAGEARLYLGSSYPSTAADSVFLPVAPSAGFESDDRFGAVVAFPGSIDGDTRSELLIGAPSGNDVLGSTTGYVDVVAGVPAPPVPVRLLSFSLLRTEAGAEIRWVLEDAGLLSGLRIEIERDGAWAPIHSGWLDPETSRYVDANPPEAETRYAVTGLLRSGTTMLLGTGTLPAPGTPSLRLSVRDNPCRQALGFRATVPPGPAEILLLDARGRELRRLWQGAGFGQAIELGWDGRDAGGREVSPGIYFLLLRQGHTTTAAKFVKLPR
jgi:FG-GAP repeat protein